MKQINHQSIALNTIILYIRMIVIMGITLYTSRVVLNILGQDNFGLYSLIGGIVVLFSFITNSMTSSTQRFLNYYIGLGDDAKTTTVFNTSRLTHLLILVVFFIFAETIGLWFVETKLNIPHDRLFAARWVYQMTIVSALLGIIVIPYRAAIIAKERMAIFSYVSIGEVVLKLLIVLVLPLFSYDNLIVYSILLCLISILSFYGHKFVCKYLFEFTQYKVKWDKAQFKELMSFSGWYLLGGLAMVGSKQGINILLNIFFSISVNAAVGIANQVSNAVYSFVTNFQTAFNPRLVGLYAKGEVEQLLGLIFKSTKFSYYLLFIIALPILLFCSEILDIWLVSTPKYSSQFTQIIILTSFFEAMSAPLWTAIGATGHVKYYQIFVSILIVIAVPTSYILLKIGANPISVFVTNLFFNILAYVFRLLYLRKHINFSIKAYIVNTIVPCIKISVASGCLSLIIIDLLASLSLFILLPCIVLITCVIIWLLGLSPMEKDFVIRSVKKYTTR